MSYESTYSYIEPILYWYRCCIGRDLKIDDLSVESMPYEIVPARYHMCLRAFRRLKLDSRKAILEQFEGRGARDIQGFRTKPERCNCEDSGVFIASTGERVDFSREID